MRLGYYSIETSEKLLIIPAGIDQLCFFAVVGRVDMA
jgi:hypothetical protein